MHFTMKMFLSSGLVLAALFSGCSSGTQELPPDAAAVVNGSTISKNEVEASFGNMMQQYQQFGMKLDSTQVDSLRSRVLESLISRELLFQESQKAGFTVSDSALNAEIAAVSSQYPDKEAFDKALETQGITEETLKKQFARNVAIRDYVEGKVAKQLEVTAEEKSKYYEEHKEQYKHDEQVGAKHILVTVKEDEPADSVAGKQEKIEGLLTKVKSGEDFSTLAKEYSDCPSAPKGGDLGYFSKGRMVKPFEDAAFVLGVGEVSDVVKTNFGFHIIQVYGKKEAGYDSFEEVEASIDDQLKRERTNQEMDEFIKELKSKATIVRATA